MKPTCLLAFAALLFSTQSNAQITPRPSSPETITQGFGLGTITLNYSRPNTKGRKIFGYVEPYDKVWRTGANSATVILSISCRFFSICFFETITLSAEPSRRH